MARVFDNNENNYNADAMGTWGTYREDLDDNGYDENDPLVNPFGMYQDPTTDEWLKSTNAKPASQAPVDFSTLYNYGNADNFLDQVDNSIAGQMRDCAECHVGGGAMEFIPSAPGTDLTQLSDRRALRDFGDHTGNYTAYSYFITQYTGYDAGASDNITEAELGQIRYTDYKKTGVLEMDCLMCHMEGYSWDERKNEIRLGRFDASRAVGSQIAISSINGTAVNYDANYTESGFGLFGLNAAARELIVRTPPSENCASCHFDQHQVDWKKRGSSWHPDTTVHYNVGCIGCHDPDPMKVDSDGKRRGGPPEEENWDGTANGYLGHDPAKGWAPYSSLWNKTDNSTIDPGSRVKTCEQCHIDQITGNQGAPDPTETHARLGLNATLVQDGRDGVVDARHLDIIHCSACHTKKLGGTGGAMVDSTGPDSEGRLTDHENPYVERDVENNLAYAWDKYYKKITPRNSLITMFWRDKNDTEVDINNDGQEGGMDPVNPSHLAMIFRDKNIEALTQDGSINATEIETQRSVLHNNLGSIGGVVNATKADLKLSFMGVLFQANHNTSPASEAWGSGGCTDCHSPDAGFYNGLYDVKPDFLGIDINGTQVTPFTKVNGSQPSDYHPTTFAKDQYGVRSIAVQVASDKTGTLRAVDRSEFLYEDNMTAAGGTSRYANNGTAYNTRTSWINHLNGVAANMDPDFHELHLSGGLGCSDCHKSIADGNFTVDVDPTEAQKCIDCHEGMKPGLHTVHLDKEIDCSACHYNSVGTFEVNSDPKYEFEPFPETRPGYSVNGSFVVESYSYPATYNEDADTTCKEWAVYPEDDAQAGEFYCANETSGYDSKEVASCTTVACHGSTQGGGYGRYDENKVDASFSVRQTDYNNDTNVATLEFDAGSATCVSLNGTMGLQAEDEHITYVEANCTYSWSFPDSNSTDGDTSGAVETVTYNDGTYSAELTMTMDSSGANNTQVVDFTTPINPYTGDRYDEGGRW